MASLFQLLIYIYIYRKGGSVIHRHIVGKEQNVSIHFNLPVKMKLHRQSLYVRFPKGFGTPLGLGFGCNKY